jgi:hypothetical protein
MKLPADAVIATEKLRDYLLRSREDHDKAGFLAVAGYEAAFHERLEADFGPSCCHSKRKRPGRPLMGRSSSSEEI